MKDKERYRIEMEDYRERQRTGQIVSDAVPLQQRLPAPDVNMVDAGKLDDPGHDSTPENESNSSESECEDEPGDKDMDIEPSPMINLGGETSKASTAAEEPVSSEVPTFEMPKGNTNVGNQNVIANYGLADAVADKAKDDIDNGERLAGALVEIKQQLLPSAEQ